jgi:rhamnose utilization protein RhaD (predicted bifunctional aldolase and dehydrogenase)
VTSSPAPDRPDLERLTALSRELGRPERDLVILGEGNTSVRVADDRMLVKASGAALATASPEDFVEVPLDRMVELLDDPRTDDARVAAAFDRLGGSTGRRPSVESMVHAVCQLEGGATVVGHTHPVAVNGLLCSRHAETLATTVVYPEQVVVLGRRPVFVPYTDPGLALAREVRRRLREHLAAEGSPPRILYLGNHGIFALGSSPAEVLRITEMAVKVSRIVQLGLAAGGLAPLGETVGERIDGREDEHHRRAVLDGRA